MKTKTKKNLLEGIFLAISILIIVYISVISGYRIASAHPNNVSDNLDVQRYIRQERLRICQEAYKNSEINKKFIYKQIPAVRCATYMTLVYAFESNYGKSRICRKKKNCFGMKGNGMDTPEGFLTFQDQTEGRNYFAKKYWKYHYKKKIPQFVHDWSMTDREAYTNYMQQNYQTIYQELEYLYITGLIK